MAGNALSTVQQRKWRPAERACISMFGWTVDMTSSEIILDLVCSKA